MFAQYAQRYYDAGLQVIPLRVASKVPAVPKWQICSEVAVTAEQQSAWISRFPRGNMGLVLGKSSGVVVIDIDTTEANLLAVIRQCLPASPWGGLERRGWP